MNIRSAIFGLVSIRPSTINEVINKLPFSEGSIYNAIEEMLKDGKLFKEKSNGDFKLNIPNDYHSQKVKEIYVKSLSYGIDPEYILRDKVFEIWNNLDEINTVNKIINNTNYSDKWVRKIIKNLANYNLIYYVKKKPIIVKKNYEHIVVKLLESLVPDQRSTEKIMIPGERRYEQIFATPDEIEKSLYEKIEQSITVKNTGWVIKGGNTITIYESVAKALTTEELFVLKIKTTEGVEDICIHYLFNRKINFDRLLNIAKANNLVNEIGCYLDIINDIRNGFIPSGYIEIFLNNISKKKRIFLKEEEEYGKSGWEEKYEKKWNVDLFIDIGSIQHGVRSA